MSAIMHPAFGDLASGRQVAWRNDNPDEFEIVTWNGLTNDVKFDGYYSHWWVDRERESVVLLEADMRTRVDDKWWSKLSGIHHKPHAYADQLPDSHFREARRIGREVFGKRRFNNLNAMPDEEHLPVRTHEGVD